MAHRVSWTGLKTGNQYIYYNLDHAVGGSIACRPEDVMLVQALLRLAFYRFNLVEPPPGQTDLKVDGRCGWRTQEHLRRFKERMREDGLPTIADGQIDPIRGNPSSALTRRHKHRYVLEVLNQNVMDKAKEAGDPGLCDFHSKPPVNDQPVPYALYAALQREVFEFN